MRTHVTARARATGSAPDRGAATTIVVVAMALALAAMTLVLSRIGHGNDLRTRAQHGADAAALAAVAEIRDRAALTILSETLPYGVVFSPTTVAAARRFASANGSDTTSVVPSGFYGHTVRAGVRTRACQTKWESDGPLKRIPCRPGERNANHGTAIAYARVTFPVCTYVVYVGVVCNGRKVTTLDMARDLFQMRLVDGPERLTFDASIFQGGNTGGNTSGTTGGGPPPNGGGAVVSGSNRQLGQRLAAGMGWTGDQWRCLDQLWQNESGWNHTAENPSSKAYGIPQALPPGKLATYGADYRTNPVPQIRWGLNYIRQRYGSPCAAWAWWQRTDPRPYPGHWY